MIAEGNQNPTSFYEEIISYSSPFWSPSGDKLGFLRIDHSDRWRTTPEVGIYNLENDTRELITGAELVIYPNEGHSIRSPKMQIDAMERNSAWFEKWMPVD